MSRLNVPPALMKIRIEIPPGADLLPVEELLRTVVGRVNGRLSLLQEMSPASRVWNLDVHRRLLQGAAHEGKVVLLTMARHPTAMIRSDTLISFDDARRYLSGIGIELVVADRQPPEASAVPDPAPLLADDEPAPAALDAPGAHKRWRVGWRLEASEHWPNFIKSPGYAPTALQLIKYLRGHAQGGGVILKKTDDGKLWWKDLTGREQCVGIKTVATFIRQLDQGTGRQK